MPEFQIWIQVLRILGMIPAQTKIYQSILRLLTTEFWKPLGVILAKFNTTEYFWLESKRITVNDYNKFRFARHCLFNKTGEHSHIPIFCPYSNNILSS